MIFEYISMIFGVIKIILFKIIYFNRINFKGIPNINFTSRFLIKKGAKLSFGKKNRIRNNVSFRVNEEGKIDVGNNCFFNDNCSINCKKQINIGNNCFFGPNVMMFDHDHDYKNDMNKFVKKEIIIGNDVWIGANVTILKGVKIGDNVVIAAGTLIKTDVPSNSIVYQKKEVVIKNKQ